MRGAVDRGLSRLISGRRAWMSHVVLAPTSAWLAVFLLAPLAMIVVLSLTKRGPYGVLIWEFTFGNYARAMSAQYLPVLARSIAYAAAATLLCLALGYPVAYWLSFNVRRIRSLMLLLLMLPFWTSCLVAIYSWMILLGREGLINSIMLEAGLIRSPIQFLNTPFAVILGLVYFYLPFMVLPLYSSLEKLPRGYLEAARDLGAGPVEVFRKVTFPLSLPGVWAGCILTFIPCVGDFLTAEFLGGPKTYLIGNLIQNQFLAAQDWPFGASMAVILMLLMAAGLYGNEKVEATTAGGGKGL